MFSHIGDVPLAVIVPPSTESLRMDPDDGRMWSSTVFIRLKIQISIGIPDRRIVPIQCNIVPVRSRIFEFLAADLCPLKLDPR